MSYDTDKRSHTASTELRDEHGHFIHQDPSSETQPMSLRGANATRRRFGEASASSVQSDTNSSSTSNPVTNLLKSEVHVDHSTVNDDMLDVHLGNPLRKITVLLEEIKKQKAFSFDLKGSLGVAGVVIAFTTFGLFGTVHTSLCSHGAETHIGTLKILDYVDAPPAPSLISRGKIAWDALTGKTPKASPAVRRMILVEKSGTVFRIIDEVPSTITLPYMIETAVTGDTDTCQNTVTIKDPKAIEGF